MSDIETQAADMVNRARASFVNIEHLIVEAAYRLATERELARWENTCANVTPMFAARFLARKGVTLATVARMGA